MKRYLASVVFCFSVLFAFSQDEERLIQKMYLQYGNGESSNGYSGEIAAQAMLNNKWVTTISWQIITMEPKNLPADYQPAFVFFVSESAPEAEVRSLSVTGGRYFGLGNKKRFWFVAEGGPSLVIAETLQFTKQPIETVLLFSTSNYSVQAQKKTTVGLLLKSDINWAFSRYAGLGAGLFANVSSVQLPVGFHVKLLLGYLRPKRDRSQN